MKTYVVVCCASLLGEARGDFGKFWNRDDTSHIDATAWGKIQEPGGWGAFGQATVYTADEFPLMVMPVHALALELPLVGRWKAVAEELPSPADDGALREAVSMTEKPKRKKRKIKPFTRHWEKLANAVARDLAPLIYPCTECGGPAARGLSCTRCGSRNPEGL